MTKRLEKELETMQVHHADEMREKEQQVEEGL